MLKIENIRKVFNPGTINEKVALDGVNPVSYTHLDVYKRQPEVCIIHGDASSQFLLESEGIHDCDAVVTMTGMDEMNMIISLYAQTCGVPQVITKVGHMENNSMQDSLGLGSVICPKELCCNTIVRYVRAMQNTTGDVYKRQVFGGVNAPYIWLKTPDQMTSWEFFDYLLENANVVGTPGSGFGPSGEGYFRLTAFGNYENTVKALERCV